MSSVVRVCTPVILTQVLDFKNTLAENHQTPITGDLTSGH